ncbi:hypothetical protein [Scopulibacillus daqui]|nr:hypothetical protein [Scopulibacillus daqui]
MFRKPYAFIFDLDGTLYLGNKIKLNHLGIPALKMKPLPRQTLPLLI